MLYTDLKELKLALDIDPDCADEDIKLNFYVEQASNLIEEILNRPGMSFKVRSRYYKGTGTTKLLLRDRPVYPAPTIQVLYDQNGFYGATSGSFSPTLTTLTYGVDFTCQWDQDDGTSRSAILLRINDYWRKPTVRAAGLLSPFLADDTGSYFITYGAGYTVDNLPACFRQACNQLVAKMRYIMPLGVELTSDTYENRSINILAQNRDYLLASIRPWIATLRNHKFG